jgi:hypothetical protein
MAEPPDQMPAAAGRGHLRASHADREHVVDVLKAAFVQGRLTKDELDARVGGALASRTWAELAALTADIPVWLTRARPPEPARKSVSRKTVTALSCASLALVGMLAAPIPDGSPFTVPVLVVFIVLSMAVPTGWLVLLHDWLDKRAGRKPAPGLPPGPGSEASSRLPSASPRRQFPPADPGHRHITRAARRRLLRQPLPVRLVVLSLPGGGGR